MIGLAFVAAAVGAALAVARSLESVQDPTRRFFVSGGADLKTDEGEALLDRAAMAGLAARAN